MRHSPFPTYIDVIGGEHFEVLDHLRACKLRVEDLLFRKVTADGPMMVRFVIDANRETVGHILRCHYRLGHKTDEYLKADRAYE
jgi:hypothetical protein